MKALFSVKGFTAMCFAAAMTAVTVAGFVQSTRSQPTQWPLSLNGAAANGHKLA